MYVSVLILIVAIQIVMAIALYGAARKGNVWVQYGVLICALGLALLCVASPFVWLEALVLPVIGAACFAARQPTWRFAALALASGVLPFALEGGRSVLHARSLRDDFPFENLRPRLAYETVAVPGRNRPEPILGEQALSQVQDLELQLESTDWRDVRRRIALTKIHAGTVEQFVTAEGFGIDRLWPRLAYAKLEPRAPIPMCPPETTNPQKSSEPEGDASEKKPTRITIANPLLNMHEGSILDFVHAEGFGLVKDVEHVAGFEPHAFQEAPRVYVNPGGEHWQVTKLALVSLLKHNPPAVYISENLPRMEELREAPVRSLDELERRAIERLFAGEELIEQPQPKDGLRMVGATRAARQCLECHQVSRGTLLGAFSYELKLE